MHLIATTTGVIDGAAEAVDLKQSPGEIVILSAADSELANLARALDVLGEGFPSVRLANLMLLQHNYSVDLYCETTLAKAKLIVVRLLGGESYWPYGVASLRALAGQTGARLAILPGGSEADPQTTALSTLAPPETERLRQYFAHGGPANAIAALRYCASLAGMPTESALPSVFAASDVYRQSTSKALSAGIVFYRSVIEGGQTAPIDALCDALGARGMTVSALYIASLKDKASKAVIQAAWEGHPPDVIINATSFAVGDETQDPLAAFDCPVLQVTLAGAGEADWLNSARGLGAKDLAMSVVLPELDGRIAARAISFKADALWHAASECRIVTYKPVADRISFVADLAANWARLRHTPQHEQRTAIILANYPNKDGRIANGVGYDTPASTNAILMALSAAGHDVQGIPASGNAQIELLQAGVTNAAGEKTSAITLGLAEYESHCKALPPATRAALEERWGAPARDPFVRGDAFHLPLVQFGKVVVGIQPARGYNIDPKSTYHDPALVPPHGYLATYFWLHHHFGAQAIIHNGKHGNLEWLPGKATALSSECWPEIALGPVPQFYPFIVNDPGEGTQAKRRTSAVIIDHLTPPLTRAETYGPLKDLEALVDEYYLASGLDRRRLLALKENILDLTRQHRLDKDAGFTGDDDGDLQKLDAYLCDLKEAQIRDGLHILGTAPEGQQEADLLVALTRVARGDGAGGNQSLLRALAHDLALAGFDPLSCAMAELWQGERPDTLCSVSDDPWRTQGDTVERLELLALRVVTGVSPPPGEATRAVLGTITSTLRPALAASAQNEISNLLRGLAGRRVQAGPSGAPTRGRLDVLPTGRNFYSLDNRTLPTPAAWNLGKRSAEALLTRHFQDSGQHLVSAALSAWGTANMRTGGDDIAQAMALIGVKPVWDPASWRVTGFETISPAVLGRPRVDVTLRISGLFRDAFPAQIELLDKAIQAVGALDEPDSDNPVAARMRREAMALAAAGVAEDEARHLSRQRIFGAKPGAYGAGLQALIDEGIWDSRSDLAAAFVTWGAYAYGAKADGIGMEETFRRRLAAVEAVIHNQDNREHDLLDSDDYYQFEGGLSAAVETASGRKPAVYHNDHSRPERPVVRTLEEEVARVMRSRVVNPKWIAGIKRHGYKGAFEIAATVDYMFAFAATADAVKSHHFDLAFDAYIADDDTRAFIAENNPHALKEIAARLEEAIARGLWQPRLNSTYDRLRELQT